MENNKQLKSFKGLKVWQKTADLAFSVVEVSKIIGGLTKSVNKSPKSYILNSIFLFFSIFYILYPSAIFAAQLKLDSQTSDIAIDQQFQIDIILDAEGESINALEGKIYFPSDLLDLKEIRDSDSIISLWIEKPKSYILNSKSYILYSGIIPGGFEGVLSPYWRGLRPGKVFSLVFKVQEAGEGMIEIRDAKVLLNDGTSAPAKLTTKNLEFRIQDLGDKEPLNPESYILIPSDGEPPEEFKIEISQDPDVFDGQYFLVFTARDKGSDIDHYELQENRKQKIENRRWTAAESPYLLKDQDLQSYIYVRAVDRAGNNRIEMMEPRHPYTPPWYEKSWVWAIIGGIIIVVLIYRRI